MTNELPRIDGTTEKQHYHAFNKKSSLEVRPHHARLSRCWPILLVLAGMPIPLMRSAHAATTPKAITDHGITSAIERGLIFEKGVFPSNVDVSTSEGIVTLSGSVASNFQKSEAEDVASRTKGVVSAVLNHLKVEPGFAVSYYAWPDYLGYGWPSYDQSPYYISEVFGPQAFLSDGLIKRNIEDGFF